MGACYSTASSYGAWVCGYRDKSLDDFHYHIDPNDADFLSDDELLGLDDEDERLRKLPGRGIPWRSRASSNVVQGNAVASPYAPRQLILQHNHFEAGQLSDGLDSTSSDRTSSQSPSVDVADGRSPRGSAQAAAISAADVLHSTLAALSSVYRDENTANSYSLYKQDRPCTAASTTSSDLVGGMDRPLVDAAAVTAHPPDSSDQQLECRPSSSSPDLTSWMDNPETLRSLDYSGSGEPVGPEDFDEFLNSVMARSLTGKYSVNSETPSPLREGILSSDRVLSDMEDDGLVVGAGGQILPARVEALRQAEQNKAAAAILSDTVDVSTDFSTAVPATADDGCAVDDTLLSDTLLSDTPESDPDNDTLS